MKNIYLVITIIPVFQVLLVLGPVQADTCLPQSNKAKL